MYYHITKDPEFHQTAYGILTAIVVFHGMWVMEGRLRPALRARHADDGSKIIGTMWAMIAIGRSRSWGYHPTTFAYTDCRPFCVFMWVSRLELGQHLLQPDSWVAPRDWVAVGHTSRRPWLVASDDWSRYSIFHSPFFYYIAH